MGWRGVLGGCEGSVEGSTDCCFGVSMCTLFYFIDVDISSPL